MDERKAERVKVGFEVMIDANDEKCPAALRDLSLSGACVTTDRELTPGQWVEVTIPTNGAMRPLDLPETLAGPACVKRVEDRNGAHVAALKFGPALAQRFELASFMACLLAGAALAL